MSLKDEEELKNDEEVEVIVIVRLIAIYLIYIYTLNDCTIIISAFTNTSNNLPYCFEE